jgi:hypothetical protein
MRKEVMRSVIKAKAFKCEIAIMLLLRLGKD